MLLKKHRCTLNLGSHSMLPVKANPGRWYLLCRRLRKMTLASFHHPLTTDHFKSYPALVGERQKQLLEGGKYLIHPISMFNFYWVTFMILVNTAHMVTASIRLCYILEAPGSLHPVDMVLLGLNLVCMLDIVKRFNTGYFEKERKQAIMHRHRIAWHYFPFMVMDLMSCLPVSFLLSAQGCTHTRVMLVAHSMPLTRTFRIYTTMVDLTNFCRLFFRSDLNCRIIRHLVLFFLTMHLFCCFIYLAPVGKSYWSGKPADGRYIFLGEDEENLIDFSFKERYQRGLFISTSTIMGTGFSLLMVWEPIEIIFNSIIIIVAAGFMIYTHVFLLKVHMTKYNSTIKYYELMDQVEKYMRHKQFPAQLQQRVIQLYQYRYQQQYFKEDEALECLSEQLRHEISLHTCHKLLEKVELFEGLPASLVGSVLGCLKPEVYMRSDLVVRAGDVGDCMYFIANGTVAVLSLKGTEVCHLEDGAHFGEVALLMNSKRVATVVAIETTQVYRLDAADFRRYILSNNTLYERIEALASHRMHETTLLDEQLSRRHDSYVPYHANDPPADQPIGSTSSA